MSDTIPDNIEDDLIIWSVIEEHFDEAAFLFGAWKDALLEPNYTLDEVERRLEGRLEANLEGLIVGDIPVAHKLLGPALVKAPDAGYAAAAALVLLRNKRAQDRDAVLDAILAAKGEQRAGLVSGVSVSETDGLDDVLKQRFVDAKSDEEKALWLSILTQRHVYPGSRNLQPCLESENDLLLAAAVRSLSGRMQPDLSRRPDYRNRYEQFVQKLLSSKSEEVQYAAIELGLLIGSDTVKQKCLDLAYNPGPNRFKCMEIAALLFGHDGLRLMLTLLQDPAVQEQALWCLGLTGNIAACEHSLPYLDSDNPRLAKLAAEAIASISGLDMEKNAFQGEEKPDENDEVLTGVNSAPPIVDPVESLNLPNPDAVKAWWSDHRADFSINKRYINGEPLAAASLLKLFEKGPMRLRVPMAYWMWMKTAGGRFLPVHAFSERQRQGMKSLASLRDDEFV